MVRFGYGYNGILIGISMWDCDNVSEGLVGVCGGVVLVGFWVVLYLSFFV